MDQDKKLKETNQMSENNVIAEFRITQTPSYKEQFLEDYNTCCLCGGELNYTHVANFIEGIVKEDASCELCHVKTKQSVHLLQ